MDPKIDGDAALRHAIRKLARADAQDDVRKQVIASARELDLRGLIPDNWAEDGTLRNSDGAWSSQEQRETYNDLYTGIQAALDDLADGGYDEWGYYIWIQDLTPTDVIFSSMGDLYSAPYTVVEGGPITIGDRVKVRPVTEYVETSTERVATPLLEWRKKKAGELRGKGMEKRSFDASGLELRADSEDGILRLTGYASVTETPYDVGFYTETIARGAFTRTLNEDPDVQLLINHTGLPLARTKSGTLRLEERERGLWIDAELDPEDPDVQSLQRKMKRGDIDQMSFAFQATDSDWSDDFTQRRIKTVSIHRGDVSVVNFGANPSSTATMRSANAAEVLHRIGGDGVIDAFTEWRDHTLLTVEERAGKTLSAGTMEVLSQVLSLVATADDAVDEAQPLLATLMGVPNPDEDEPAEDEGEEPEERAWTAPDFTTSAALRLTTLRAGGR